MRIALVSFNPTLGAFSNNTTRALAAARRAQAAGAELVVLPVCALSGAPMGGLAGSAAFVAGARAALDDFVAACPIPAVVSTLAGVEDAAAGLELAGIVAQQQGYEVPQVAPAEYAAHPEAYYVHDGMADPLGFASWDEDSIGHFELGGRSIGVTLNRTVRPSASLEETDLVIALMADAYQGVVAAVDKGPGDPALEAYCGTAALDQVPIAYLNLLGGQDGTVFDGRAALIGMDGRVKAAAPRFSAGVLAVDVEAGKGEFSPEPGAWQPVTAPAGEEGQEQADWNALCLASHDYVTKNGAREVVIGLSGGIDSSVVATVMADALGAEAVHGVLMPSPYSSEGSVTDALQLAENLGIDTVTIPITPALEAFKAMLAEPLGGELKGLALENIQARIRTLELYAFSNDKGWMVINTGNKSEAAMGFSTLYGDTAGAYAPLGDIYKTRIYQLARWRNEVAGRELVPANTLVKPPSAELHPGQRDDQRLPSYEVLDPLLLAHIEGGMGGAELIEHGFDESLVKEVLPTVKRFEFKRRNEPVGPEISGMPLTSGRAWPLTNGWSDPCA